MKTYQVFSIDVCFDPYAISYVLVGAENKEDLISHLGETEGLEEEYRYSGHRRKGWLKEMAAEERITEVPHLYTDTPYKVLDRYSYYE